MLNEGQQAPTPQGAGATPVRWWVAWDGKYDHIPTMRLSEDEQGSDDKQGSIAHHVHYCGIER